MVMMTENELDGVFIIFRGLNKFNCRQFDIIRCNIEMKIA